uniref:RNase H type-1 domain-containing protein n=1 Tax=Cannabis sativa TaxID=3483 RepID=A0A803NGZ9_CANSA
MHIEEVSCPLCGEEEKTMEHLVLYCNFASHLWRSSRWGVMPVPESGGRMWNWVKFLWGLKDKGVDVNESSYYNLCLFPTPVICTTSLWSPPPEDWVKINCDVKVGSDSMCVVALARDHKESILWIASNILSFSDPLIGEAVACLLALESAVRGKLSFVIIESDSETVINTLKGLSSNWGITNYVTQCKKLLTLLTGCNFSFIFRSCNYAAHNVAKWAFNCNVAGMVDPSSIPSNLFYNDREV